MNKYLIELIKLQNSVILPGFGALMIGNSKSGKIVFNPHLKFNDGALAKFIAEKDGIDQQTAQNQVAKFIREIEAELGKGNSFDIFQFGKFKKKSDGTVDFIQEGVITPEEPKKATSAAKGEDKKPVEAKTESLPADKTGKPAEETKKPESLLDKLKASETKKTDPDKKNIVSEEAAKTVKNSFTPADEKPAAKEVEPKKSVEISRNIPLAEASKKDPAAQEKNSFKPAEELKKEPEKTVEKIEDKLVAASDNAGHTADEKPSASSEKKADDTKPVKKEEKPKQESIKEKFKKDKPQRIKHENPEAQKPKKKKRWVRWVILLIIVGGGATAGWFYKNQINDFLFAGVGDHDKDTTATTSGHVQDTTATTLAEEPADTSLVSDMVEEPVETTTETVEKPIVNHSGPGGSYHIIGGSFSSETNADNYVKKMTEKGYSARNLGKHKGLYLVSLKSFGSREEAKNNLESVKADASGAYIFKGN